MKSGGQGGHSYSNQTRVGNFRAGPLTHSFLGCVSLVSVSLYVRETETQRDEGVVFSLNDTKYLQILHTNDTKYLQILDTK